MTQAINISALTVKVEEMISAVRNGGASQYHSFLINEDEDDEEKVTIRVSNHKINPERVSGKSIVFVIPDAENEIEREEDDVTSFHINKKSFKSMAGQYSLDEDNCDENGNDVEYILDYELN